MLYAYLVLGAGNIVLSKNYSKLKNYNMLVAYCQFWKKDIMLRAHTQSLPYVILQSTFSQ